MPRATDPECLVEERTMRSARGNCLCGWQCMKCHDGKCNCAVQYLILPWTLSIRFGVAQKDFAGQYKELDRFIDNLSAQVSHFNLLDQLTKWVWYVSDRRRQTELDWADVVYRLSPTGCSRRQVLVHRSIRLIWGVQGFHRGISCDSYIYILLFIVYSPLRIESDVNQ